MRILSACLFVILIVSCLFISSCRCPSCSRQEETVVPREILDKADFFIKQRTGNDLFEKYISPDFVKTKFTPPYFNMVYRFIIPDKPYVNTLIEFWVDTTGTVVKDRDITGIPNCLDGGCNFNITEEQAIKIAKDNGLEKGIKEWKTGFIWDPKLNQYVWHILSTNFASQTPDSYKGNGKEVIIDPCSGLVLAMNDWFVN
jgi:hypothetical protein